MLDKIDKKTDLLMVGWCEWCTLPKLGIPAIKAKVDTGAKTSAIHAFNIYLAKGKKREIVHFSVHPIQGNRRVTVHCKAPLVDMRSVMSSNGHKEQRYVIQTPLVLGDKTWDIEVTLSNRDPLQFRMLLGRTALEKHAIINPARQLCQRKLSHDNLVDLYSAR